VKYILLLPLSILITLLALILAPVLPLFAIGKDKLPGVLSWFQTPDSPIYGDVPFRATRPDSYLTRVTWLLRNPGYGFEWSILASTVNEIPRLIFGKAEITDTAFSNRLAVPGWYGLSTNDAWEFYWIRPYPLGINRCFRLRLGWKLGGFLNDPCYWKLGGKAMYCFSLRPWAHYDQPNI